MLDAENPGVQVADADAHVQACTECRIWYDAAAAVTRHARLSPATAGPDLTSVILAQATVSKPSRRLRIVRISLVVLGVAQLVVTVWQMRMPGHGGHGAMHLEHESAAWGFALAVGFCWIAWQTRRASGLVPVLGVFIAVLSVLVAFDLRADAVSVARAASHSLLVIGFVLVVYISRATARTPKGGTPVTGPTEFGDRQTLRDVPVRSGHAA